MILDRAALPTFKNGPSVQARRSQRANTGEGLAELWHVPAVGYSALWDEESESALGAALERAPHLTAIRQTGKGHTRHQNPPDMPISLRKAFSPHRKVTRNSPHVYIYEY